MQVWNNATSLPPRSFTCFNCKTFVGSNLGYFSQESRINRGNIHICPNCSSPTYFDSRQNQIPSPPMGNKVDGISDEALENLYTEACITASGRAYTAAVMACRKILMHIAVDKGAKENLSFLQYVKYLSEKGYIPPDGKHWVDHIREKGNEANHEIVILEKEDAEDLIFLVEMLLRFIYEMASRIPKQETPVE